MHAWKRCNKNIRYPLLAYLIIFVIFNGILSYKIQNESIAKFVTSNYGIVQYPEFSSIENSQAINSIIIDKAMSLVPTNEDVDGGIQYTVLECSSKIISIEFYGDLVYIPTKKTSRIYSCISIDVNKKEQIKLPDIIKIDDDFVENYMQNLYLEYQKIHPNTNNNPFGENKVYTSEYLKYHLNNADELSYNIYLNQYIDSTVKSCLFKEELILSLELPQALGFHIEVKMSINNAK